MMIVSVRIIWADSVALNLSILPQALDTLLSSVPRRPEELSLGTCRRRLAAKLPIFRRLLPACCCSSEKRTDSGTTVHVSTPDSPWTTKVLRS
jgi:hypothetical protein